MQTFRICSSEGLYQWVRFVRFVRPCLHTWEISGINPVKAGPFPLRHLQWFLVWNRRRQLQLKWIQPPGNSKFLNLETWQWRRVLVGGGGKVRFIRSPWKTFFFYLYLLSFLVERNFDPFSKKKKFISPISSHYIFKSNIADSLIVLSQDLGRLIIALRLATDGGWTRGFHFGRVMRPLGSCTGFSITQLYLEVLLKTA